MRFLARFLLLILLISGFWIFKTSPAFADGEFKTDYKVSYTVDKNGVTTATYDITLENKTPNYYADKFELKIGSTKITEVVARDTTGELETELKFENNTTTITTKFKQRVIGVGKTLNWTLTYRSNELAIKSGQIWEISIPKVASSTDIGNYDVEVITPKSLGEKAFAIPTPKEESETSQDYIFNFDKDMVTNSGIALSFGDKQVFTFNLKYYLENPNITSQTLNIALPPDNNYQKLVLTKIEPKPLDVIVDEDGNFLAQYKLKPKEKIEVSVAGDVEVFSKPFRKIKADLTDDEKKKYLQPQSYWEIDNTEIREKAQELKTPQAIYDYVTKTLKYNSEKLNSAELERKGAAQALANPQDSVCTEFTDLFISLARAAGIPAREVEGYAYTQNDRLRPLSLGLYEGDILHAWPEYWDDEKGWVQIDPTWAATSGGLDYFSKMDFNHVTFVQRGLSSTQPYPAGAYKSEEFTSEKTVYVQFAQDLAPSEPRAEIDVKLPGRIISSLPFRPTVVVKNVASTSIIAGNLSLKFEGLPIGEDIKTVPILPPFSQKSFDYSIPTKGLLNEKSAVLVASFAESSFEKEIKIEPFYAVFKEPLFFLSILISLAFVTAGFYFYRKHKGAPLLKVNNPA